MLHPSYSDLMKIVNEDSEGDTPVVNSRYTIVMAAAKRAREITSNQDPDETGGVKPLSQAVEELQQGLLKIVQEGETDEETAGEQIPDAEIPEEEEVETEDTQTAEE